MVESGRISGKARIRASIEKVRTSTGKGFNQCVYRKIVEFGSVTEKGRIRASIEKLLGRVREEGAISVRTEKW